MKAFSLPPLLAAGIVAAPAPPSDTTASLSPELDDTTVSMLSKGYEKSTFELSINEHCCLDAKLVPSEPELHAYARFFHGNDYEYSWDFARSLPKTFTIDNTDLSIRHDYDTSCTSFEYGECKWKDGETVDKSCGWCDQGAQWQGPGAADQIDCSARPELSRVSVHLEYPSRLAQTNNLQHRTITCHFWRKATSESPPELQLSPDKDGKGIAASTANVLASTTDDDIITLVSDASAKAVLKARGITADREVPDNLYRFGVTHSEWCEDGALKACGWMRGHELNFYKDFMLKIPISLHPGRDLLFGPYSTDQHAFAIEYDGCVWTSDGGWPCGWCEVRPWTLGPLNCQTLQPGYQRSSYRTCYFVDARMSSKTSRQDIRLAGRALQPSPTRSTLPDNTTFSLFIPPVITAPPQLIDITPSELAATLDSTSAQVDVQASTVTLRPAVIETVLPDTPKGHKDLVLPFHIQVWEYCFEGARLASGVYRNGNIAQSLDFTNGSLNIVGHRVPGYAPALSIGFEYEESKVRFGFPWREGEREGCEWFDDESWKSCGECREKLWSGGPLDCGDKMSKGVRLRDMDCSLLLGLEQTFRLDGAP